MERVNKYTSTHPQPPSLQASNHHPLILTPTASSSTMSWEIRYSNSRKLPYFYNPSTQESRWEAPPNLAEHEIHALPGAAKYLPGVNRMAGVAPEDGARGKPQPQPAEGQVRASHILAKHTGSRRPSSWRQVSSGWWGWGGKERKRLMRGRG